jgi:hypothetical protein
MRLFRDKMPEASAFPELRTYLQNGPRVARNTANYYDLYCSCWVICSATAVYTTKQLMVTHGYREATISLLITLLTYARFP